MTKNKSSESENGAGATASPETTNIAEIAPKKVEKKKRIEKTDAQKLAESNPEKYKNVLAKERSLLAASQLFLREYGVRRSSAAIRDAVEMPHEVFSPVQAVSALSQFGFKASFGSVNLSKLTSDLFPLIAFNKQGEAVLVKEQPEN